jgi:hypothetical protein
MSESMARRVRTLQTDLFTTKERLRQEIYRRQKLEGALEKLLWRLNKEGDGPLPQEAVDAERVLRNG